MLSVRVDALQKGVVLPIMHRNETCISVFPICLRRKRKPSFIWLVRAPEFLIIASLFLQLSLSESASVAKHSTQSPLRLSAQEERHDNYRIGKVDLTGAGNLAPKRLARACGIRPNAVFKPDSLQICKEQIKRAYLVAGFIKAVVEVEPQYSRVEPNTKRRIVDILITVTEGNRYHISAIEFLGNDNTRHRIVQQATGLHVGDPFDPLGIARWVSGINRLGRFEKVKAQDVETEIDDQEQSVLVRFHLKEKV